MTHSDTLNELATALAKAQGEIEGATKDKTNPHFKSAYADLASVWDACRKALTKNGLAILQPVSAVGPEVTVTTLLTHSSGQWLSGELTMTATQNTPQGIGSCITYARRYALASMVGVAPEDDDGNAASQKTNGHASLLQNAVPPVKPSAPAGFDDWLADLTATADEGVEKLRKTWTASKVEYRTYLTKLNPEGWESLKAKAAQSDAQVPA